MASEPIPVDAEVPLQVTRQIDALCDEFEQALKRGGGPQLGQFLHRIDPQWRQPLLKELTELVLERLRADGTIRAEDAVLDANPSLHDELSGIVHSSQDATVSTEGRHHTPVKAAGLSVRCPHCHGMIPLVVDASLMEICCEQCGGTFSLVNDAEETRDAAVLSRVAHFEIIERLGMGEFGTVWKARDTLLDRTVALKIPRREQLGPLSIEKFMREARAAAQLRHPNIVSTHEVGREGDTLYIVIDYVRGVPLSLMMADHRLGIGESIEMLAKIAAALDHAHRAGVIHRDLKPSNILVDDDGEPHLMDFGLAKRKELEVSITTEGAILGTPAYMSPEQARGEANRVDGRSDIYSAGVVLFQMLTGELPFRGSTRMLLQKVINDDAPGPRTLESRVPRDLDTICLKCLEKEPARRYASAGELADDLKRFLAGQPVRARRLGRAGRTIRWARRNPMIAALLAATAATLLVATGVSLYFASQAGQALGDSLLQEIRLTREVRRQGYGEKIRELVTQIRSLPFARVDENELRRQVSLTFGDVVAYSPRVILPSGGSLGAIALSPDGRRLYVAQGTGELVAYDVDSGREIAAARLMDDKIAALAAGDAGRVVIADYQGNVQELELRIHRFERLRERQLGSQSKAVVLSPHGEIAALIQGANLEVWDTSSGKKLKTLPTEDDWVLQNAVFDRPRGELAAGFVNPAANSAGWAVWKLASGHRTEEVELPDLGSTYIGGIDRNPTGEMLALGFDLALVLIDAPQQQHADLPAVDSITAVAFHPTRPYLAVANIRGSIGIWNLLTRRQFATLQLNTPKASESRLAFSGDGHWLVAANSTSIQLWNFGQIDEVTVMRGHQGAAPCAAFDPTGRVLASGGKDNQVRFWNVTTGQQIAVHDCGAPVQSLAFSPDGRLLAIGTMGNPAEPHLLLFEAATKSVVLEKSVSLGEVFSLDWSAAAGETFLAASGSDGVGLWKLTAADPPQLETIVELPRKRCLAVVFDCDSQLMVWAEENRIQAWDVAACRSLPLRATEMNQGWHGLSLAPDGESLLYVSTQGIAESWQIRANRRASVLGDPGTFVAPQVALSDDGQWFAALTPMDTVSIWHRPSGMLVYTLRSATSPIWSLAWDPSGRRLAVGQSDGSLAVWHFEEFQQRLARLGLDWREPKP